MNRKSKKNDNTKSTWPPNPPGTSPGAPTATATATLDPGADDDVLPEDQDAFFDNLRSEVAGDDAPDVGHLADDTEAELPEAFADDGVVSGPEVREAQKRADEAFIDEHDLREGDFVNDDGTIERAERPVDLGPEPERDFERIPVKKIRPHPDNRPSERVEDLVPSIRERGVIQPILVRKISGDRKHDYELIAGERRWRAAQIVGLKTIPAMVGDEDQGAGVLVDQLVENLQREGLKPMYEARGYRTLLDELGGTQHELADRLGVSQANISKKLSLLDLPQDAVEELDSGGITVTDAVELARLKDHPKILVEVLKAGQRRGDIVDAVADAIDGIDLERQKAALRAKYQAEKVKILPGPKNSWDHFPDRIGDHYDGVNVDKKKHESEPCHAVRIQEEWSGQKRVAVAVPYCTNPKRHSKSGGSDLIAKKPPRSSGPAKSDAQKRREAAEREATKQRREALAALLQRKPPKDFWQLIAARYVADAAYDERQKMCQLLGIEIAPRAGSKHSDTYGAIDAYAAQSDAHLAQTAFAFLLVQGEFGTYVDSDAAALNRRLLLDAGYEPHPAEKADFKKAAKK